MAILQNVQQDGNYLGCRKSKKRYFFEIRANKKAQQTLGNSVFILSIEC